MLNILKEMQSKGIFKLLAYSAKDIDTLIKNATTETEIIQHLTEIQNYIKQLNDEYTYTYNVTTNKHISDFCDKFQFTMFDMDVNSTKLNGSVYTKDIDFNQGGVLHLEFTLMTALSLLFKKESLSS